MGVENQPFLQGLLEVSSNVGSEQGLWPAGVNTLSLMVKFSGLFFPTVVTALMAPYEIDLADIPLVRSPPYRCASPKHEIFQHIVIQLLEQGVVRDSKSSYASPALLVPKGADVCDNLALCWLLKRFKDVGRLGRWILQ